MNITLKSACAKDFHLNCQDNSIDYRTLDSPSWDSPQKENPPLAFLPKGGVFKTKGNDSRNNL